MVWAPFQLIAIMIVSYQALLILDVPSSFVTEYDEGLFKCGIFTVSYFILACLKDTGILLYFLIYGKEKNGFDQAIFVHMLTLPLDVVVIAILSIWGSSLLVH